MVEEKNLHLQTCASVHKFYFRSNITFLKGDWIFTKNSYGGKMRCLLCVAITQSTMITSKLTACIARDRKTLMVRFTECFISVYEEQWGLPQVLNALCRSGQSTEIVPGESY